MWRFVMDYLHRKRKNGGILGEEAVAEGDVATATAGNANGDEDRPSGNSRRNSKVY